MMIELALVFSAISLAFGLYEGLESIRRGRKKEVSSDTASLTTVIVKLESIGQGVSEIKSDLNNVKSDIQEVRERIIKVEESAKQAHRRIDSVEKRIEHDWCEEL